MKLKEIQNLIKFVAKSGANEVSLEMEDVKITIKTSSATPPIVVQEPIVVPQQPSVPVSIPTPDTIVPTPETPSDDEYNLITITSPIIGTFYRKPCKIVKILVDDSSPVEFDQPLFLVDPS